MAEVALFHHVQGLTAGVRALADELRQDGHTVHTPDAFDGATFATLDDGMAHASELGFGALMAGGVEQGQVWGDGVVYLGISMGVMPAQNLAQTHAGARAAILVASCIPVEEFGAQWPDDVPVQVHGMDADPIFAGEGDLDAARELVDATDDAELFLYEGSSHLFVDSSLPSYDADAAALFTRRVRGFLDALD